MDKIGFSWYPHFQRLLLLYYLLTRSLGCKDKLCGLFLRAKGCHGAWQTKPFIVASTSRRIESSNAIPTRGRQRGQRNKDQRSGSMLQRAMVSSNGKLGKTFSCTSPRSRWTAISR